VWIIVPEKTCRGAEWQLWWLRWYFVVLGRLDWTAGSWSLRRPTIWYWCYLEDCLKGKVRLVSATHYEDDDLSFLTCIIILHFWILLIILNVIHIACSRLVIQYLIQQTAQSIVNNHSSFVMCLLHVSKSTKSSSGGYIQKHTNTANSKMWTCGYKIQYCPHTHILDRIHSTCMLLYILPWWWPRRGRNV
jgi:hypothetical protein